MRPESERHDDSVPALAELKLKIHPDLYRAFQRCTWILVHETGRTQIDVMDEMVEDFLRKHGC
ncbi:MAG: hypothetical protein ABFS09_00355 [Thermodesulfobacteriota bacterium]